MATITNVDPPKIPWGYNEKFIDYAKIALAAAQIFGHVTTDARPETDFEKAGITISTNRGQPVASGLSKYIYFGDVADVRDATGGSKPKSQYTRDDMFHVVANITARYGGKLVMACDEQQENEGDWQYNDQLTPQQNEWYLEAWKAYQDSHPEFLGFYSCYSGSANPVTFSSPDTIAQALSSPEAAFNYLKTIEFYKVHYWTKRWYRYRGVLINMYIHQNASLQQVMAELVLTIRIHQLALQFVGRDPHDILVFFWTDSASGLQNSYTERYVRPVPGGILFGHGFPGWCAENMVQISRYTFEHCWHGFNWWDTYLFGRNINLVPPKLVRGDNYVLSDCDSSQVSRTPQYSNPSPYRPSTTQYPFPPIPHSGHDMGALGAWWKTQARLLANAEPQPVEWRQNNEPFINTTPSVYWVRTWTEKLAWVEMSRVGNTCVVTIYDVRGRYCVKGRGTMDIRIDGQIYTVSYLHGVHNQITIQL